jgi:hypothetical protein
VTYQVLGPSPYVDPRDLPAGTEPVGAVHLHERRIEGGDQRVRAVRIDPVTVVDPVMLGWIRTRSVLGVYAVDDQLILDLENGRWVYRIGDYDPLQQGVTLRLIEGAPLQATPRTAGR